MKIPKFFCMDLQLKLLPYLTGGEQTYQIAFRAQVTGKVTMFQFSSGY